MNGSSGTPAHEEEQEGKEQNLDPRLRHDGGIIDPSSGDAPAFPQQGNHIPEAERAEGKGEGEGAEGSEEEVNVSDRRGFGDTWPHEPRYCARLWQEEEDRDEDTTSSEQSLRFVIAYSTSNMQLDLAGDVFVAIVDDA